MLGTAGVLIGLFAALLVVRRTVRPLASIATSIRAVAGGEKNASIPATDVDNEIGDIARAAEVFRQTLVDADAAREAAVRALAEQRLAEESYRKLFEGSVDGIYVTTPGGALLNANPALARMMGYATPQRSDQRHRRRRRHRLRSSRRRARNIERLMERDGMVREFEYQVRARDGAMLWLSDSASAVRNEDGELVRYEGTVRDITDQKRAEDAIAEGRRLLQMVIDTVPAVINVKDKQLRYVLMNRYMAGIFGIEPADAIGRTTTDLMSRYGAAEDRRERQAGAGGRQGARLLRGGISRFLRQHAAMAGQQAADPRCGRRDREHRHRRARHRRAQARRTRDAQGQGRRRKPRCAICGKPRIR